MMHGQRNIKLWRYCCTAANSRMFWYYYREICVKT